MSLQSGNGEARGAGSLESGLTGAGARSDRIGARRIGAATAIVRRALVHVIASLDAVARITQRARTRANGSRGRTLRHGQTTAVIGATYRRVQTGHAIPDEWRFASARS